MGRAKDMAMITSTRAPVPVAEVPRAPRPAEAQAVPVDAPRGAMPIAPPLRAEAVRQGQEPSGLAEVPFQVVQVSATAAAEAAKAAYIRARIAAGLNPLPLP